MLRNGRDRLAELGFVGDRTIHRKQCDRLQCDAAFPFLAHLGEDRPRDRRLFRIAVDVGAQRAGAVREGAAQREVHALGDILGRPVHIAIRHHGGARAEMRAVRVLRAMPDVTLVDVSVHVDEPRQHDAVVEIEALKAVVLARGTDRRDAAVVNHDIAGCEAVGVGCQPARVRDQAYGHARVDEAKARRIRRNGEARHRCFPRFALC